MKHKAKHNGINTVSELQGVAETLLMTSVTLAAGFFLGVAAGALLRLTGLHWSWAVVGVPFAALAWLVDPVVGLGLSVASASALGLGAQRSFAAHQKGGEEKARERERSGIIATVTRLRRTRRALATRVQGDRLAIGAGAGGVARVPLGLAKGVHCFIPGATGSGKTVTATVLLQAYLRAGVAVIAIDPKSDAYLAGVVQDEAQRLGVSFRAFGPQGGYGYNVAARGDDSAVAEKVLAAHEWSEPHYRSVAQRFAQETVAVLRGSGVEPSLQTIGEYLHPDRLEALAAGNGNGLIERVDALVGDLPRRMLDDLAGARSRIAMLAGSAYGELLDPSSGRPMIDLAEVISSGEVAYFRLDADGHPALAKILAAALVIDLITLSSKLQGMGRRAALFFDEFAALGADQISRLFASGRSAGLSVILATQAISDLVAAREDDGAGSLVGQVLSNLEFALVHRQSDPESAQMLAELAGTYATWTMTESYPQLPIAPPEARTKVPTRAFRIHPDTLKSLGVGQAAVIEPTHPDRTQVVDVWPAEGQGFR